MKTVSCLNRPWVAAVPVGLIKSFAESAAVRPLCSLAVLEANWAAVVAEPRRVPMMEGQSPQKMTSSKEAHRRRRDPIRPCHS